MKTIWVMALSLGLFSSAFAQRKITVYHAQPSRVVVAPSVGFRVGVGYPYYGYGYRFGSPYYYGAPYYGYRNYYGSYRNNSKLNLQIESIKLDYKKQIKDVRHDKSITHTERRAQIRDLKNEREQAIISAQQAFINRRNGNSNRAPQNNGSTYNNGQNTGTQDDAIQPGKDNATVNQ